MNLKHKNFEYDATHAPKLGTNVVTSARFSNASSRHRNLYNNFFKRLLDVVLVVASLPIILPIILVLSILGARDGHNPFFSQKRLGKGGRVFTFWKLRTMVPDADQHLEEYLSENSAARREWNEKQKLLSDPRITRFGRILRKTSLDELPQLWNVLIGDMSLVGPRPMMVEQRDLYPGTAYYALRPGLTGYWQVSDRHQSTFSARAGFDHQYYREVSLVTDAKVIVQTISVVLRGTGC